MNDLEKARKQIEEADKQIAAGFEKRMEAVKEIGLYKKALGLPIEDKKREAELIVKEMAYIENEEFRDSFAAFLKQEIAISKRYQRSLIEGIRIAYSGVPGAYAYFAAKQIDNKAEPVSFSSFDKAYESVVDGACDLAVLPIENSYAGDVGSVMDLAFNGPLFINHVIDYEVRHALMVNPGTKIGDIKTVMSHPQALAQCDEYIRKHGWTTIDAANTAVACMELSKSKKGDVAVLASVENAELYGLDVLDTKVNVSSTNTTRFAVFSRTLHQADSKAKTDAHFIITFTVKNESGSLASALNIIGAHGFNMRSIRSRPMKTLMWNYYFFVEIEGSANSVDGKELFQELNPYCDRLKLLGTY